MTWTLWHGASPRSGSSLVRNWSFPGDPAESRVISDTRPWFWHLLGGAGWRAAAPLFTMPHWQETQFKHLLKIRALWLFKQQLIFFFFCCVRSFGASHRIFTEPCGILVSRPGIEPASHTYHWTTQEVWISNYLMNETNIFLQVPSETRDPSFFFLFCYHMCETSRVLWLWVAFVVIMGFPIKIWIWESLFWFLASTLAVG